MPEHLIIECGGMLRAFGSVVCCVHMPMADLDAVLSKVFDALAFDATADRDIQRLAYFFSYGEELYEHSELTAEEKLTIYHASERLLRYLRAQLLYLGTYQDGQLCYDYKGMLNHDTLILVLLRSPAAGAAAGLHSGHP